MRKAKAKAKPAAPVVYVRDTSGEIKPMIADLSDALRRPGQSSPSESDVVRQAVAELHARVCGGAR